MEKVCSHCAELQTIIDKQKHDMEMLHIELDCLYSEHEENCKETAEINREIKILKDQLNERQKVQMKDFAKRREEALLNYQEEYRKNHPEDTRPPPPPLKQVDGYYVMDIDENEDMIDVPILSLPYPKSAPLLPFRF